MRTRWLSLIRACHPEPTAAVTVLTTVLFISAGNSGWVCLLGALAILTGQLSIGWSNDLIDASRDAAAGRSDKPVAVGDLDRLLLTRCCGTAVLATVACSLALGWRPGLLHLAAVGAGWAYNLGLKSTVASPVPYLFAFASLPVIATLALTRPHLPPAWLVLAAALIGGAAHFGNVLPDLAEDAAAGVRGLPHRLGPRPCAAVAAGLTVAATVLVLLGPAHTAGWVVAGAAILVLAAAVVAVRASSGETAFYATMLCAALDVGLIAASGALG